jgi:hypothetical protein
MSAPVQVLVALFGLIVSAQTRVTVPVLGPVPVLGIAALAVALALAAVVLILLRLLLRDARLARARTAAGGAPWTA